MKVYVITRGDYSDYSIMAVALDKSRAKELATIFSDDMYVANVEEYDSDTYTPIRKPLWFVTFYKDLPPRVHRYIYGIEHHNYPYVREVAIEQLTYTVYVQADDEEHALKIASDELAKYKAEKEGI